MSPHEPRHLPRRTVIRTGVTAAWATPAIVLATAAPAFAGTGTTTLTVPTLTAVRILNTPGTARRRLVVESTISNTGAAATTALMARVVLVNTETNFGYANSETFQESPGWSFVSKQITKPHDNVILTYVSASQLAPGATTSFSPIIDLAYQNAGDITLEALPGGGGTSGSRKFSFV